MAPQVTDFREKYRPKKFSDVIGNKQLIQFLKNTIVTGQILNLLFNGEAGTGKTSLAYVYAKALCCENFDGDLCDECEPCKSIEAALPNDCAIYGLHIHNCAMMDENRVDEKFRNCLYYINFNAFRRDIHIWDEFHRIRGRSQDKFLKPLESNSRVLFIFCLIDLASLEPAFLQRVQILKTKRPEIAELILWLHHICEIEGIAVEDRQSLIFLAQSAERTPRECLRLLQAASLYGEPLTNELLREVLENSKSVKADRPKYTIIAV